MIIKYDDAITKITRRLYFNNYSVVDFVVDKTIYSINMNEELTGLYLWKMHDDGPWWFAPTAADTIIDPFLTRSINEGVQALFAKNNIRSKYIIFDY